MHLVNDPFPFLRVFMATASYGGSSHTFPCSLQCYKNCAVSVAICSHNCLFFYYRCSERFVVNSIAEVHFSLFYFFFCLICDDCCCTFVCLLRCKAELFFNSFGAVTSLRDKLFLGLVTVISASCALTISK